MTDAPDPGLTDLIAAEIARHRLRYGSEDAYNGERWLCTTCPWLVEADTGSRPNATVIRAHANHVAEHLKLALEQHTNGRIAELGWGELVAAIPDGWELQESAQLEEVSRVRQRDLEASQATTARWRDRAEKAEATITRVITALEAAEKSVPDDWGVTYIYTSQLRAALEGEQQ